jgi:hypothetical protein
MEDVRGYTHTRVKGSCKEEEKTMRNDQTVAEMANEVLMRQAEARADQNGDPIEAALKAVVGTEAGRQLAELRDGPHGDEGVEEWQVGIAQERAKERAEDPAWRLSERVSEHPTHG